MTTLQRRKIGVLGGTFDPIHIGHLRPALEVKRRLELDEIRLVPCHLTSHKEQPERSSQMRSHLCKLAASELPGFLVDERELRREQLSYTADTLADMHRDYPEAQLYFLLGSDSFDYFHTWHRWEEILEHATLVVMARPDNHFCPEALQMLELQGDRIVQAQTTELHISSTAIRELLAQGRDPRYLVPDPVREYLLSEQLYLETT
ncbi:MAG: nicotinate-nucleotide adenylyltransferase [Granulosicoccaceae bacterium]